MLKAWALGKHGVGRKSPTVIWQGALGIQKGGCEKGLGEGQNRRAVARSGQGEGLGSKVCRSFIPWGRLRLSESSSDLIRFD